MTRDFTLEKYEELAQALKQNYLHPKSSGTFGTFNGFGPMEEAPVTRKKRVGVGECLAGAGRRRRDESFI